MQEGQSSARGPVHSTLSMLGDKAEWTNESPLDEAMPQSSSEGIRKSDHAFKQRVHSLQQEKNGESVQKSST